MIGRLRHTRRGRRARLGLRLTLGILGVSPAQLGVALLGLAGQCPAGELPAIERYDARIDAVLASDARLEELASGFHWLEGPAWHRDGGYLLFSDIPANAIYRWREREGVSLHLAPSGYSGALPFAGREPGANGLLIDAHGRLLMCEHGDRRLSRLEHDGTRTALATHFEGRRLNSPNDVIEHSNGALYFTDPPFGLPGQFDDPARELDFSGVFRLAPDGSLTLLTRALRAPNGLAFSPDESSLYVTDVDAARPAWWVYPVHADGTLGEGRRFADAAPFVRDRPGAPDGIETDRHGNVFGAGPGGIYVFAPDATLLAFVPTGVATANLEWGDDGSTLYVTADTRVYRIRTTTRGARIAPPPPIAEPQPVAAPRRPRVRAGAARSQILRALTGRASVWHAACTERASTCSTPIEVGA